MAARARNRLTAATAGGLALVGLALVGLVAGCGGAGASPAGPAAPSSASTSQASPGGAAYAPVAAARSGCAVGGASRRANAVLGAARHRYQDETGGSVIHAELRRIAHDARLLHALAVNDFAAAQSEALVQVFNHHHVVQIRVLRGARVIIDANPNSFDVAGSSTLLKGPHGRHLGTLEITVQDVIGFIKLTYRHDGAAGAVVRGASGHVETNLPAAARRALPARGCVTVAGRPYLVRSFPTANFTGEKLTVWLLVTP